MINYYFYETIIGYLTISADEQGITDVSFGKRNPVHAVCQETPVIKQAVSELQEYFEGRRREFTVPLHPQGTDFQLRVWQVLRTIPYGKTWSYKQVATAAGNPNASRAVGMANNRNPIAIIIPCHRVIGANGRLVGYAGGLDVKEKLLEIEQ
ncbi:methylated-DNA--[protein]-cysteine S-methyltransferase [Bacteroides graminisolvens]|jgi:methylated-DNA-[protein]-cysteine S-methyltransferase|uniref:methylated-DNA--[protein]-cysteine S-methyltransferase n=1 Tax=Bacteroides graminisolvens TaxID=477666 RepID=UPI002408FD64|nr:methylated-DNA--[protein]-cysteine S-methyltransferase [Bacteroides graminisolvens]